MKIGLLRYVGRVRELQRSLPAWKAPAVPALQDEVALRRARRALRKAQLQSLRRQILSGWPGDAA